MKSMRKLVLALFVLTCAGSACDATRRDFKYCDKNYGCTTGYCDLEQGLCMPGDAASKLEVGDATQAKDLGLDLVPVPDAPADLADPGIDAGKDLPILDAAG